MPTCSSRSYQEALTFLSRIIQAGRAGQKSGTPQQVADSCKDIGIELSSMRTIHIAVSLGSIWSEFENLVNGLLVTQGTKGKGSTSSFTERILRQAGLRTGLYTSPHLIDVRERIRINGRILNQELFAQHFWAVHDKLGGLGPLNDLHFFHFLTVLGFYIFQQVYTSCEKKFYFISSYAFYELYRKLFVMCLGKSWCCGDRGRFRWPTGRNKCFVESRRERHKSSWPGSHCDPRRHNSVDCIGEGASQRPPRA